MPFMSAWRCIGANVPAPKRAMNDRFHPASEDAVCLRAERSQSGEKYLIIASSDGRSALKPIPSSASASRHTTRRLIEQVWLYVKLYDRIPDVDIVGQMLENVRKNLAHRRDASPSDHHGAFDCTAILVVLGPRGSVFAQVGDGVTLARWSASAPLEVVTSEAKDPRNPVNATHFLVRDRGNRNLVCKEFSKVPVDVIVSTDGMEPVLVSERTGLVNHAFLDPLANSVSRLNPDQTRECSASLAAFLDTPIVDPISGLSRSPNITDDDVSMVIATRRSG